MTYYDKSSEVTAREDPLGYVGLGELPSVADIGVPAGAEVIERDAQGNPTVAEFGGEKYFLPGSTPYETGHRTESERARFGGQTYGVHSGSLVPEATVIVMEGDRPDRRLRLADVTGSPGSRLADIDDYIARGAIRYPVKDYRGQERLLTPTQAEKLFAAEPSAQLRLSKEYKLVPRETTLKEFTATEREIERAKKSKAAQEFVSQQEEKRMGRLYEQDYKKSKEELAAFDRARDVLSAYPYMVTLYDEKGKPYQRPAATGKSINITAAVKEGHEKEVELLFGKEAVAEAKGRDKSVEKMFLSASKDQQDRALAQAISIGDIKIKGKFNIKDSKAYYDKLGDEDKGAVLAAFQQMPAIERELELQRREAIAESIIVQVPIVGTAYLVKTKAPTWEILLSGATDVLIIGWLARSAKVKVPGMKTGEVAEIIDNEADASRATLAKIDKRLVKPFDEYNTARKAYADNLGQIKTLEKRIAAEIEVAPEVKADLKVLRGKTAQLESNLEKAGDSFSQAQLKAVKPSESRISGISDELDGIYREQTRLNNKLIDLKNASERKATTKQLRQLAYKQTELETKYAKQIEGARIRADYESQIRLLKEKIATEKTVAPEVKADLRVLQERLNKINKDLTLNKSVKYAEGYILDNQRRYGKGIEQTLKPGYDIEPLINKNLGRESVREIKQLVEYAFEKPSSLKAVSRDIDKTASELNRAKLDLSLAGRKVDYLEKLAEAKPRTAILSKDFKRELQLARAALKAEAENTAKISAKLTSLKSQRIVALSAEAEGLSNKLTRLNNEINVTRARYVKASASDKKEIKELLDELVKEQKRLEPRYIEAVKGLDIEWAEAIQRSSGRGTTLSPGRLGLKPPRIAGGGGRGTDLTQPILMARSPLYTKAGFSATPGWKETSITTISFPDREVIRVEPQPYWGEVIAPVKPFPKTTPLIPQTQPAKRPDFDPKPGIITWTPSVVLAPELKPGSIVEFSTEPETLTRTQLKAATQAIYIYGAAIATGLSPSSAAKEATEAVRGIKLTPDNKIEAKTSARALTQRQLQTRLSNLTDMQAITSTKIATTTTTVTTTPKAPPEIPKKPPLAPRQSLSDKEKRERIKKSPGATTINMGKLKGKDVWHTWLNDGTRLVTLGKQPEGTKILADGQGSAYKTTQRIGSPGFDPIKVKFGFMRAGITPTKDKKGATVQFSPFPASKKEGKIYITDLNGYSGYSRRPIRRRRNRGS